MKIQKEQGMRMLFVKWQQSGKTKTAFCKEEGLTKSTFHYWAKKFQGAGAPLKEERPGFTPLVLGQSISTDGKQPVLRINYRSGASVDFFGPIDVGFVKELCQ